MFEHETQVEPRLLHRPEDSRSGLPVSRADTYEQPGEAVELLQPWAPMTPLQHDELLAKDQVLDQKSLTRTQKANQRSEAESKETKHSGEL